MSTCLRARRWRDDRAALAEIRNRRIGFVFQRFNLLASLTAWRNVELPLTYAGVAGANAGSAPWGRSTGSACPTGLSIVRASCPVAQQQRVAMARALVTDPA